MTEQPQVLVVGAGSIGARHVRNLAAAGARVTVVDPDPARAAAAAASVSSASGATVASAVLPDGADLADLEPVDAAVVASPTRFHADQAAALLDVARVLLVEKPLATTPAAARPLVEHTERVAVAYNLRFHRPVERLLELVDTGVCGDVTRYRLWFGSWLPGWRPGTDYRTTYSARADLGGGVLLDAIHELDLLVRLAGPGPHHVVGAVVDRLGDLEIDVEDTVSAVLRTAGGPVAEVSLDYLARNYRRGIEVTGTEATVRLDWARSVIEVEDGSEVRREDALDDLAISYVRQAEALVAWARGGPPLPVDARAGLASLELAAAIEGAAERPERP